MYDKIKKKGGGGGGGYKEMCPLFHPQRTYSSYVKSTPN